MASDDTPLIAGPIHGIRQWTVGWNDGDADLRGFGDARWADGGEPTRARCRAHGGRRTHRAPKGTCSCGLYAVHPWEAPRDRAGGGDGLPHRIYGIVEGWGRVELHATGFRAQFARPVALAVVGASPDSDAGNAVVRLAERYRAEVIEVANPRELAEHCRERGWGLSQAVVRSLVPKEPSAGPALIPSSSVDWRARLGEWAWMAVWGLAAFLWYGFLALFGITILIAVINGDFGSSGEPFSDRKLRVIEQALVRRGGELRYVAIVRNTSEKRIALGTFARGKVLDARGEQVVRLGPRGKSDWRPTLLPGETGVVVDELPWRRARALPDRLRFETELVARRAPARKARPPVALGGPALDRGRCLLSVPVEATGAARGTGITIVARNAAGAISAAGSVRLGRAAIEHGRRVIELREAGDCPGWLRGVETYPLIFPSHVGSPG